MYTHQLSMTSVYLWSCTEDQLALLGACLLKEQPCPHMILIPSYTVIYFCIVEECTYVSSGI